MVEQSNRMARLRVSRGFASGEWHYDHFEVPYEEGMSVLDALRWIRANPR